MRCGSGSSPERSLRAYRDPIREPERVTSTSTRKEDNELQVANEFALARFVLLYRLDSIDPGGLSMGFPSPETLCSPYVQPVSRARGCTPSISMEASSSIRFLSHCLIQSDRRSMSAGDYHQCTGEARDHCPGIGRIEEYVLD